MCLLRVDQIRLGAALAEGTPTPHFSAAQVVFPATPAKSLQANDPPPSQATAHVTPAPDATSGDIGNDPRDPLTPRAFSFLRPPSPAATEPLPWERGGEDHQQERSDERSNRVSNDRQRVRHSFDIFADQLLSLRDIALRREVRLGHRTRLGDLVQEALDEFIAREFAARAAGANGTPGPGDMAPQEQDR